METVHTNHVEKEQSENLLRRSTASFDYPPQEDNHWSVHDDGEEIGRAYSDNPRPSRFSIAGAVESFYDDNRQVVRRYQNPATILLAAVCGFLLCYLLQRTGLSSDMPVASSVANQQQQTIAADVQVVYQKPEGLKVVGLIFYGRPMFVNLLDCYLQKNLVVNGGYLDEVHFIANTKHEEDLDFLDQMVRRVPEYIRINKTGEWTKLWEHTKEIDPEAIIIKIDDDIIYMADDAIPRVVHSLIAHPEAFCMAGNVINTPHSHYWQYHTGAIQPYLPEPINDSTPPLPSNPSWRASLLPQHPAKPNDKDKFNWNLHKKPLANMTRWLPLPHTSSSLWRTPAINSSWPVPSEGWTMFEYSVETHAWQMAAQVHYSFLENLENDALYLYRGVGDRDGIWDQQYERYSINFLAINAGKIANLPLAFNDEVAISMGYPKMRKEPFLVDTRALVSHYSFSTQHQLLKTDVLARYLSYANEMVCAADNQKEMIVSSMVRTGN